MMDHRDKQKQLTNVFVMLIKKKNDKEQAKKVLQTSVWLLKDLRARLPVLFEGTKYGESNDTGKLCSFSNDLIFFHGLINDDNDDTIKNK